MKTPLLSPKTESDKLTSTILLHHEVRFSFERQNQLKGTELGISFKHRVKEYMVILC